MDHDVDGRGRPLRLDGLDHQTDVVERGDMRMSQRRNRPRLALEPGSRFGLIRQVIDQDLDRDGSIESRIVGLEDLSHSPGADERQDLVVAQAGAGC